MWIARRLLALSCVLLPLAAAAAAGVVRGNAQQYEKYLQECVCTNTCVHRHDGACNDGGAGSVDGTCALGTDCADCGPSLRSTVSTAKGALCPDQLLRLNQAAEQRCPASWAAHKPPSCAKLHARHSTKLAAADAQQPQARARLLLA